MFRSLGSTGSELRSAGSRRGLAFQIFALAAVAAATSAGLLAPAEAGQRKKTCHYICDPYGSTWKSKQVGCNEECPTSYRRCYLYSVEDGNCPPRRGILRPSRPYGR